MLTPHSTERSLVPSPGFNLLRGLPLPIGEEEGMDLTLDDLIREAEVDVEQGKEVRSKMQSLQEVLHSLLETLADADLDLASIIGEGGRRGSS